MNTQSKLYLGNEQSQSPMGTVYSDHNRLSVMASEKVNMEKKQGRWRLLRRVMMTIVLLLLAGLLYLLLLAFRDGLRTGEIAPDFVAHTIQGEEVRFSKFNGKETMLVFWSPDCSICREELPSIQAIAEAATHSVNLLTIVSYVPTTEVKAFVAEKHLTFPVISDETGEISKRYNVHGIPFTYLIKRDGVIDSTIIGGDGAHSLSDKIFSWKATCDLQKACTSANDTQ